MCLAAEDIFHTFSTPRLPVVLRMGMRFPGLSLPTLAMSVTVLVQFMFSQSRSRDFMAIASGVSRTHNRRKLNHPLDLVVFLPRLTMLRLVL